MPKTKAKTKSKSSSVNLFKARPFNRLQALALLLVLALIGVFVVYKSHASGVPCINQTLKSGSSGHCVTDIQLMLNGYDYFRPGLKISLITVDGKYGQQTAFATGAFQKEFGQPVTGVVYAQTWAVFCKYYGYKGYLSNNTAPLRFRQAVLGAVDAGCLMK